MRIALVNTTTTFKMKELNFLISRVRIMRRPPSKGTAKSTVGLPNPVPGQTRVRRVYVVVRRVSESQRHSVRTKDSTLTQPQPRTDSGKRTAKSTVRLPRANHQANPGPGQTRVRAATFSGCDVKAVAHS